MAAPLSFAFLYRLGRDWGAGTCTRTTVNKERGEYKRGVRRSGVGKVMGEKSPVGWTVISNQ
jgi:hypothetical protein